MSGVQGKIFRFNDEREAIVREVVEREYARRARSPQALELALNDAAFSEIARLEESGSAELAYWQTLYRHLGRMDPHAREVELRRLLERLAADVVGNFDPKVYRFATRVVPIGLSWLMRPQFNWNRLVNLSTVRERILVQGELDLIRKLSSLGTLILVPTHLSNLDSLVIGWSLFSNDLPPFTYGAGKNLFFNPLISYFMQNLGAYKVDRRLRYGLYKDVLKAYSQVLLERGYHSLFFPGGTRCRSGAVEKKLKLGLLGSGLSAGIKNVQAGRPGPAIFVVPCTLNYHLVLEAETLIGDQLKADGQHRYIIEDDESSRLSRIWDYFKKTSALDSSMVIHYGAPMDLWGNRVDENGVSYDDRDRPVDTRTYLLVGDEVAESRQR
ncbi:MAG: 1-acyl-sn-glycerol-3-phosphate acyltransferase, partial [Candidatus Sericytochromatia bacterium]|nr:1-acyl-sn-glycerol-3-phosphate acyltransferase [Candidatus Tanganyikabacteria bacterium]